MYSETTLPPAVQQDGYRSGKLEKKNRATGVAEEFGESNRIALSG